MAHLTNPPGYGDNSWDESTWAAAMAAQVPRFRVADANAWKPSVAAGVDRTVQVAVGGGWGCGVWDKTSAVELVAFDANVGGSDRFDLLVARWSWSLGTVVFAVIKGTTVPPTINTSATVVDSAKVNRIPGVRYEGVIAVVRVRPSVGPFAGTDLYDLRVWGGLAGPLAVLQAGYVSLIDGAAGDQVAIVGAGGAGYRHNGTAWVPMPSARIFTARQYDWVAQSPFVAQAIDTSNETGFGTLGQQAPFTLYVPTRMFFICQFRVDGPGAAVCTIKVDGVQVGHRGIQRVDDESVTVHGQADLLPGTHIPSLRVDANSGSVSWISFYLTMSEGTAE